MVNNALPLDPRSPLIVAKATVTVTDFNFIFPLPVTHARPQCRIPDEVWWMRQRDERGAVGTIVGVLLAMGVVFGFLAISVDVGSLLWERRQLQNAADAAALSLATECGKPGANCTTTAGNLQAFANANSNDGRARCCRSAAVNIAGSGLSTCPAPPRAAA